MHRLLHTEYFTEIKIGSKILPNDTPKERIYADNPKQFSLLYNYKLLKFFAYYPIANEIDFINENLKQCDEMIFETKRFKDNLLDSGDRTFTEIGMNYELILIEKWKEFLINCKTNIQKTVKAEIVIATMNLKQPYLTNEDVNSINSNMKLTINRNFEYFRQEYGRDCDWDKHLYSIYFEITNYYYQISNTKDLPQIKLLYVNLQNYQFGLKAEFESFERFFEFLISANKIDDCIRLLNFIRRSIVDYNDLLNQSRYSFSNSYFYDTINKCYADMENKYNAEKLKLLTIKSTPVKKPPNKKETTNNYSHKQIRIAYFIIDEFITNENAESILKKHSNLTSVKKFLEKTITNTKSLTRISENKTTDTKHLNDLKEAKRLIISLKNKKGITKINQVLTEFEANYKNTY